MGNDKYKNKFSIPSSRASWWNYQSVALYFITICAKNHFHFFGKISNGEMILSEIGEIVSEEWINTPLIRGDMNLHLDEFIVMPNHFHSILLIGENAYNENIEQSVETRCFASQNNPEQKTETKNVEIGNNNPSNIIEPQSETQFFVSPNNPEQKSETRSIASLPRNTNKFGGQSKNLGSIIRGFKSAVTKRAYKFNNSFQWQAGYYDHIIRNEEDYIRIREYILKNPLQWEMDKYFKA